MACGSDATLSQKHTTVSPGAACPLPSHSARHTVEINQVTNNRTGGKGRSNTPTQVPNGEEDTPPPPIILSAGTDLATHRPISLTG